MDTGIIKTIRHDRGFGFIKRDRAGIGSRDLFFHQSMVVDGRFADLQEGQHVAFEVGADPGHPERHRALDVRPVETGNA